MTMRTLIAVALTVTAAVPAAAQEKPIGSVETLGARVPEGRRVTIVDRDGRETTGDFVSASAAALDLRIAGQLKTVAADQVWEVRKRGDSVLSGFLVGFAIAAGVTAFYASDCDYCEGRGRFIVQNATGWGVIGMVIDAAHVGQTTVFRAGVRPVIMRPQIELAPSRAAIRLVFSR